MPRTIRFHLDETYRQSVAKGLRLRGIDVTTSHDAGLAGASDEEQLAFARDAGRAVLTHDSDFVALHSLGPEHSGIIYCHQRRRSVGEIIRGMVLIWEVYDAEEMRNRLEYLLVLSSFSSPLQASYPPSPRVATRGRTRTQPDRSPICSSRISESAL